MFTNVQAYVSKIITDLEAANLIPGVNVSNDEPLELVYSDLPNITVIPTTEDFVYDDSSNSSDMKELNISIQLRMQGSPATTLCSPVINQIVSTLRNDAMLGSQNTVYVEFGNLSFANDRISDGKVCGASLDIKIRYYAME